MAEHARHGEPGGRRARLVVVAAAPVRVGHDRGPRHRVQRDALRVEPRRRGAEHARAHVVRVAHGPFERLHPAQRAARRAQQRVDPQLVEPAPLGAHDVGDRDDRKGGAVRLAGARVERRGPRRAAAPAEHVRAEDVVAVGVERLAGPDQAVPPADPAAVPDPALGGADPVHGHGRVGLGGLAGRVRVAGDRVEHEDHVGAVFVELAVRLVGDPDLGQRLAALELERLDLDDLGRDDAHAGGCGRWLHERKRHYRTRPIRPSAP